MHLYCTHRSVVIWIISCCLFRKSIGIHQYTSVGNGGGAGVFQSIGMIKGILVGLRPSVIHQKNFFIISFQYSSIVLDFKMVKFILF
jgi:hypothetical protein